jgi:hypothetical protein
VELVLETHIVHDIFWQLDSAPFGVVVGDGFRIRKRFDILNFGGLVGPVGWNLEGGELPILSIEATDGTDFGEHLTGCFVGRHLLEVFLLILIAIECVSFSAILEFIVAFRGFSDKVL